MTRTLLNQFRFHPWRTVVVLTGVVGFVSPVAAAAAGLGGVLVVAVLRRDAERVQRPEDGDRCAVATTDTSIPRARRSPSHVVVVVPRRVPGLHPATMDESPRIPTLGSVASGWSDQPPLPEGAARIAPDVEVARRVLPSAVRFLRYDAAPGGPLRVSALGGSAHKAQTAACLVPLVNDEPLPAVRLHALEALWRLDSGRAEALGAAHADPALRLFVASNHAPPDVETIVQIARHADTPAVTRCAAALSWRDFGGEEAEIADVLVRALPEPSAISALAEFGAPRHLAALNAVRVGAHRGRVESAIAAIHARHPVAEGRLSFPHPLSGSLSAALPVADGVSEAPDGLSAADRA